MSQFKENLYHPVNYTPISTYTGYNWPSMLCGVFWGIAKGLWGFAIITFAIAWFTWGLGWIVTAGFANAAYKSKLDRLGYLSIDQLPDEQKQNAVTTETS